MRSKLGMINEKGPLALSAISEGEEINEEIKGSRTLLLGDGNLQYHQIKDETKEHQDNSKGYLLRTEGTVETTEHHDNSL